MVTAQMINAIAGLKVGEVPRVKLKVVLDGALTAQDTALV